MSDMIIAVWTENRWEPLFIFDFCSFTKYIYFKYVRKELSERDLIYRLLICMAYNNLYKPLLNPIKSLPLKNLIIL